MSSDSGFCLPKSAAKQMVDNFYYRDTKDLKTVYNTYFKGGDSLQH